MFITQAGQITCRESVRTIIAHGYVCHNFLQDRLPFGKLFVLCFSGLQLGTKFLTLFT